MQALAAICGAEVLKGNLVNKTLILYALMSMIKFWLKPC